MSKRPADMSDAEYDQMCEEFWNQYYKYFEPPEEGEYDEDVWAD